MDINSDSTLRQWAGLTPPTSLDPEHTALLCIDYELEFFAGNLVIPHGPQAVMQGARLIEWAEEHALPVFHVHHVSRDPNARLFSAQQGMAAFHPDVEPKEHHTVVAKHLPSAFAETNLEALLKAQGIDTLIVAGFMTHMCVTSAVCDAYYRGFRAVVAADACADRNVRAHDGNGIIPHLAIHRNALAALADRFADVMDTDDILALTVKKHTL